MLASMEEHAGSTHGKGFIDHLSEQLKPLCKGGASSANHLRKCRKLAGEWPRGFVDALHERGVPWHAVLKAFFACSQTKSLPQMQRAAVIAEVKKHLRQFPKTKRENEVKNWLSALNRIKGRFAARLGTSGKLKQLKEAGDAISFRLRDAADRLKRIRKLLSVEQRELLDQAVQAIEKHASGSRSMVDQRLRELREGAASSS